MATFAFETALGYTALALRSETVLALSFGHPTERAALRAVTHRVGARSAAEMVYELSPGREDLVERLQMVALGEPVNFDDISIDMTGRTLFQRKVLKACRAIPRGSTRTYGELARETGYPGAARAVGSVMASNRIPLIVPCHRVVPASGGLGGFSAPQGVSMKKRLLALESSVDALVPAV